MDYSNRGKTSAKRGRIPGRIICANSEYYAEIGKNTLFLIAADKAYFRFSLFFKADYSANTYNFQMM